MHVLVHVNLIVQSCFFFPLPDSKHDFQELCELHQQQEGQLLRLCMIHESDHFAELVELERKLFSSSTKTAVY